MNNAATTPVKQEVFESMKPYFAEDYGNPSGFSNFSERSKDAIEKARDTIAGLLGASGEEIYFTSGGTESDNWALKAIAFANRKKGTHIITSKIEHHAILRTCEWLGKAGFDVTYVNVDENGFVDSKEIRRAIRSDTILISVMTANNEIGTIQPIREIGTIARERKILFHTDAVQAYGHIAINVNECGIDLLSASGHKINGPKGIGILYIRKGTVIGSFMHGGEQEHGRRAGTYNTPGIVGFGKATELAQASLATRSTFESELRDYLIDRIIAEIPYSRLNGHKTKRLPNNVNISFKYVEGESMLIMLDQKGICASGGSACTSGSLDPSHVLLAIGLPHEIAHGSLRITLSEEATKEEVDYVVEELKKIVQRLRSMSPLYEDFIKEKKENVQ